MDRSWKRYIPPVCGALGLLCLAGAVWAAVELDITWLEAFNEGGSGTFGPALGEPGGHAAPGLLPEL